MFLKQKLHHSILDEITDFIALPSYYLVNFAHDAAAELMLLMKKQTNKNQQHISDLEVELNWKMFFFFIL